VASWPVYTLVGLVGLYILGVLAFFVGGSREDARAIGGFVPDCVVLFSRLVRDKRLPGRHKWLVGALIPYLAMPFVAFVLRRVARKNPELIREHWPGPSSSLALILRLAGQ
jgi:hypothetical protein